MPLTRPTVASAPLTSGALEAVTPPAPTSEAVASGGSVTGWTFSAFTDPDSRIASYSATLTAVVGSGSLSGTGLGPYSLTGTADGDSYTVELDALDGGGAVLATATHSVAIATSALPDPTAPPSYVTGDYITGGYHDFDGVDDSISFGNIADLQFQPSDTFTLSLWIRNTVDNGSKTFVNNMTGTNQTTADGWFYYQTGSVFRLGFVEAGTTAARAETPNISSAVGAWVHHFVVWDNGTLTAWSDGVSVGLSAPLNGSVTPTYAATDVQIGGNNAGFSGNVNADIAEVAIWSGDQSALVASVYNSRARHDLMDLGTPPDLFYAPLTSYGDNPDGTAGAVFEAVSGNDGTGVNMDAVDVILPLDTTVTSTRVKVLDVATSTVTTTDTLDVGDAPAGTGSSFP